MSDNAANQPREVLQTQSALEQPSAKVTVEDSPPNRCFIPDWPKICTHDYVNAVVFNSDNRAMIFGGSEPETGWASWQMFSSYLRKGDEPVTAVNQHLLKKTGYSTPNWIYLGSYMVDPNRHLGIGHFFCARGAKKVASPDRSAEQVPNLKWVSVHELRFALLDGRIASLSHAIAVSLSLLTVVQ